MPRGTEDYGEHSPNYLSEKRRKKALKGKTRDEGYASPGTVGALAGLRRRAETPGEAPEAAQSLGDLMSPSTFGREGPPSSEQEFQERKQRNAGWLKSRETQAALLQFGISMLSSAGGGNFGGNVGRALALAAGAPGRLHQADRELTDEERKAQLQERTMGVAERRVGIEEEELQLKQAQMEKRRDIFGGLGADASDDDLMDRAAELAAIGDTEGANLVLKMMKSQADPAVYQEMKQYQFDVSQGYIGTLFQWRKDKTKVAILEQVRQKVAAGVPLSPGEKQLYEDSKKGDVMLQILKMLGGGLPEPTQPGEEEGAPATGAPASGTSGDVHYNEVK